MALSLKDYPQTNLHINRYGKDKKSLRQSIVNSGSKGEMNKEMPPWRVELSYQEIEALILFLKLMHSSPTELIGLVKSIKIQQGGNLFQYYCSLCHGKTGNGDGRMAEIINDPPPFDLTKSVLPAEYLQNIITLGGAKIKRSERMPPWGDEFTDSEINSIIGIQYLANWLKTGSAHYIIK